MSESFLHYIWKHQYFDKKDLLTTEGEPVDVFGTGYHNTDSGPDFKESSVRISDIDWRGQVEIHYRSSDWYAHGHQHDDAYSNTVLHVVWQDDKAIFRPDGTKIPAVELQNRVDLNLLQKYDGLIKGAERIPCAQNTGMIKPITKLSMLDKAVLERLERKSTEVTSILSSNNNDWEETAYQLLSRSFGFKINSEPFFELARSVPFKVLKKHADNIVQIEALLFGQAGFLSEENSDGYFSKLKMEYDFLKSKYRLENRLAVHQWKFLRLRPANFPTVRLAQLAAVMSAIPNLFSSLIDSEPKVLLKRLRSQVSNYWGDHYNFGSPTSKKLKGLGKSSAEVVCVNTVAPLLVAYSKNIDDQQYLDRAIDLLQTLPAEKNRIVDIMKNADFDADNAFDSQGLIELYNNFCTKKKCLQCNIGAYLVRP